MKDWRLCGGIYKSVGLGSEIILVLSRLCSIDCIVCGLKWLSVTFHTLRN